MPKGTVVTASFGTAATNGWSNTDNGMVWTTGGAGGTVQASDWQVAGGFGTMSQPTTAGYRMARLATFDEPDVDLAVSFKVNRSPVTGAPIEAGNLALRGVGSTLASATFCLARVRIETTGSLTALIFDRDNNTLGSVAVPGVTFTGTSQLLRMRVQAIGKIIRVKAWDTADSEPVGWPLTVVDDEVQSGWVGVRVGVASGNTNTLPVVGSFTNFQSVQVVDFEHDKVPVQVLAAFGADLSADWTTWTWTDITSDVLQADGQTISISPMGRSDEFSQAQPAGCQFRLLNISGDYTAYNPASSHYPNVRRNTPIWVLVGPSTRFFGYANGFTPNWDASGRAAIVSVSASGSLRRLQQGNTPITSPATRGIAASGPVVYLPMEDPVGSTQFASALPGGTPVRLTGDWTLASNTELAGSMPLPVMSATSAIRFPITVTFTTGWQVDWHTHLTALTNPTTEFVLMRVWTYGTANRVEVVIGNDGDDYVAVRAYSLDGTQLAASAEFLWFDAMHLGWAHLYLTAQQNGSNVDIKFVAWPSLGGFGSQNITTSFSGTWGGAAFVEKPANAANSDIPIGHLAVYDAYDFTQPGLPMFGYTDELVTDRLTRVCDDNGVPLTTIGSTTTKMGAQSTGTLINVLRECEAADQGVLLDGIGPGLTYITRAAKQNLTATLTLDGTPGLGNLPLLAPVDDDQRTRNLYQVTRKDGSTATYEDADGPMGTEAVGTYDSSLTVNLNSDSRLYDYAAWLVHQGTVEGFRYPTLPLNFRRSPALAEDWLSTATQDRIDVTNASSVAPQHPPGTVSLLLEGYTETVSPFEWTVQANCSPYEPWVVTALNQNFALEMAGQTLAADLDPGDTTLSLATAAGHQLFTTTATYPDDFPMDLNVGGWKVHVTAATGTSSPQTLTVSATPNTATIPAGTAVTLWQPAALAL